jgi:hypothetical protein
MTTQTQATISGHEITSDYTEAGRVWAVIDVHDGREAGFGDLAIRRQSDSSDHLRLFRVTGTEPAQTLDDGRRRQKVWLEFVAAVVTGRNPSWRGTDRVVLARD